MEVIVKARTRVSLVTQLSRRFRHWLVFYIPLAQRMQLGTEAVAKCT